MTTCSCVGFSTMKPCCRILSSSYKSSSLFGFSPTNSNGLTLGKSIHSHRYHKCDTQIVGYINVSVINLNQRDFRISDSNWGQSRIFSTSCSVNIGSARPLITNVASDFRNHSTSVDSSVNKTGFDKIYIQGGLNVKASVIERMETLEQVSNVNIDNDLNEGKVERELSEIEKEAWKLLQDAVVTYHCSQ